MLSECSGEPLIISSRGGGELFENPPKHWGYKIKEISTDEIPVNFIERQNLQLFKLSFFEDFFFALSESIIGIRTPTSVVFEFDHHSLRPNNCIPRHLGWTGNNVKVFLNPKIHVMTEADMAQMLITRYLKLGVKADSPQIKNLRTRC
jgi:hypothetical protein